MDAVLLASTQTSRSIDRARQADSAKNAACCVFPLHRSQSCADPAPSRRDRGTRAMGGLRSRAIASSAPVADIILNLSASGGTGPDRTGQSAEATSGPTAGGGAGLSIPAVTVICTTNRLGNRYRLELKTLRPTAGYRPVIGCLMPSGLTVPPVQAPC